MQRPIAHVITPDSPVDNRLERIPLRIFASAAEAAREAAREIADLIRQKAAERRPCVLGLATGSSPVGLYRELIRLHREEGLSFRNVVTFNLDEYHPLPPEDPQSYHHFMTEQLFAHVDILPANTHVPDGTRPPEEQAESCAAYEAAIAAAGGLDLQVLGIGRTGHIGFNEPGSRRSSTTRLIALDRITRHDAAGSFGGEDRVPRLAVTMGVGTILKARRILLLAYGEHKAPTVHASVEGPVTPDVPATYLQDHPNALMLLDPAAASELTRVRTPWLVGGIEAGIVWDEERVCQAVTWLADKLGKPILKLTDGDYNTHGLQELIARQGPAYEINRRMFYRLQNTITGWPGGKPADRARDEGQSPPLRSPQADRFPKTILVFSPHPDDDVISMGGTLMRLAAQGHKVHVAYCVSGSNAVADASVERFLDFQEGSEAILGLPSVAEARARLRQLLREHPPGRLQPAEVRALKALIRRGEARAAGRLCGLVPEDLHFLDLPFYDTGLTTRQVPGAADVAAVRALLEQLQPDQIYAAGDLADPHGTHRACLGVIGEALRQLADQAWLTTCECWLYRGAWAAWPVHQVALAVPLSPDEVRRKRTAIFQHETQKDQALFLGPDEREFWQRAEERTRAAALQYDRLGLAEYEAIETFARWGEHLSSQNR